MGKKIPSFKILHIPFLVCAIFLMNSSSLFAQQVSNYVSQVSYESALEGQPIILKADLLQATNVASVTLAYKTFGQTEFVKREMDLSSMSATILIPAEDVTVPYLEYYLIVQTRDGSIETYPYGVPDEGTPQ